MQIASTSTQRTYRYVRLSLVGAVALLFVALAQVAWMQIPLASVSAAYFTPARDIFVGSVFAIALALLALSGRSLSQALLDYAALVAPLIAIVPTAREPAAEGLARMAWPITAEDLSVGVNAYVLVAGAGVITALVLAIVQRTLTAPLGWTIAVAGVIVALTGGWWVMSPQSFVDGAHTIAATVFFALMAAVSALAAWGAAKASRARTGYAVIAGGLVAALAILALVVVLDSEALGSRRVGLADAWGVPVVLIAESAALVFFATFWIMQTVEYWSDPDPSLRVASRP